MPRYLQKRRRGWYAVLEIPKGIRGHYDGKRRLVLSLKTDSQSEAERRVLPVIAKWKEEFELVKNGLGRPLNDLEAMAAEWQRDFRNADVDEKYVLSGLIDDKAREIAISDPQKADSFFKVASGNSIRTDAYIEEWLSTSDNQPKTIDMQRSDVLRFAETFPYSYLVDRKAVQLWLHRIQQEENLKNKTLGRIVSPCRGYWDYLDRAGYITIEADPFKDVTPKSPKGSKASQKDNRQPFTIPDLDRLLQEARSKDDQELWDIIWLGMWTGCRIEEIGSLTLDCVKADRLIIADAKTDAGNRVVPIHSRLVTMVERLSSDGNDGFLMSGLPPNKYDDRSNAVGKRFGGMKTRLGYNRNFVFHSIRMTVATELENAGVAESVAADIVGHEKQTMTYGLYSGGTSFVRKQQAIEKLDYDLPLNPKAS